VIDRLPPTCDGRVTVGSRRFLPYAGQLFGGTVVTSVQIYGAWESQVEDPHSLVDAILALERPDPIERTPAGSALDRLLAPTCELGALRMCAVFVLMIAATACIALVQLARSPTHHIGSMLRPAAQLSFSTR
jgi:hypothetical protein